MADSEDLVRIPRTILIGAVARNRGKTEFACEVVRSLSSRYRVHAVKVTTIHDGEIACIHGDEGCGVCDTMSGDCAVSEETDRHRSKDTSRMLASGAERVWWIRVREHSLGKAAAQLAGLLPDDGVLVLESNSIREVCEPDLFFMLGRMDDPRVKESAKSVVGTVDRFVSYDGTDFDFDADEIGLHDGRLVFRRDATAIILAGGKSTRMGADKRLLPVHGRPLVTHVVTRFRTSFGEVLLSVDHPDAIRVEGVRAVPDSLGDSGPMGGVISALAQSRHEASFVAACDIPTVDLDFVYSMMRLARDHDVVVPVDDSGRFEPLFAVYSRATLPLLREMHASGERRIRMLYDHVSTARVPIPPGVDLRSLNTREDYQAFQAG